MADPAGIAFKAPNGCAIAGTEEVIPGRCGVVWYNPEDAAESEPDGTGTDVDWDGQIGLTLRDTPVFIDESGWSWLATHLLAGPAEPFPERIVALMRTETALARIADHCAKSMTIINGLIETIHLQDQRHALQLALDEADFALKRAGAEVEAAVKSYYIEECWMILATVGEQGEVKTLTICVPAANEDQARERAEEIVIWMRGNSETLEIQRVAGPHEGEPSQ